MAEPEWGAGLRVDRPRGFWRRNLGLLVRPMLQPGEVLWLDPCGSIHTFGVLQAIDAVFLDGDDRVLRIAAGVPPWRVVSAPWGTRSVLELPAGGADGLRPGARVSLRSGG